MNVDLVVYWGAGGRAAVATHRAFPAMPAPVVVADLHFCWGSGGYPPEMSSNIRRLRREGRR